MTQQVPPKHKGFKVIAIASRKGGAGKSSTTINIAQALRICTKRVAIIDADDQQSIRDWEKEVQITKRDIKYGDFFPDVIAEAYTPAALNNIFNALDNDPDWQDAYDYILVDLAGHLNQIREGGLTSDIYDAVLMNADMVIMVNNPDIFTVRSNKEGCKLIEDRIEVLGTKVHLRSLLNNVPTKENSGVRKCINQFAELEKEGKMWKQFNTTIEHSRRVSATLSEGCTAFIPVREKIADSYYALMKEIVDVFGADAPMKSLGERKRMINGLVKKNNFAKD